MSKREVRKQLTKGRAVALLSEISGRDHAGRPNLIEASGGGVRGYMVKLDWAGLTVRVKCQCPGSYHICYHALGAVIKSLEEIGDVAVSPYRGNLTLLKRTGGNLFTIKGHSGKEMYALVKNTTSNKDVYKAGEGYEGETDLVGELV